MSIQFLSLRESESALPQFFAEFKEINVSRGGDADGFDGIVGSKMTLIQSGGIDGFVMWDDLNPVGIVWVEKMTSTYGSILVYCAQPRYAAPLVDHFVASKIAVGVMSELLHFESDESMIQLFRNAGLAEIPRQRMVCHLADCAEYPEIPEGMALLPLTRRTSNRVAELSFPAHQMSGDYRGYVGMETYEGRLGLENLVHDQFYGPVCQPATVGLVEGQILRSIIINILVPCWGLPKVPWIYDISTAPDSMGSGYGEWLLKYSKAVLTDFQFPMWGLAVSMNNIGAIKVYERNGFIPVDCFSEFIQHS